MQLKLAILTLNSIFSMFAHSETSGIEGLSIDAAESLEQRMNDYICMSHSCRILKDDLRNNIKNEALVTRHPGTIEILYGKKLNEHYSVGRALHGDYASVSEPIPNIGSARLSKAMEVREMAKEMTAVLRVETAFQLTLVRKLLKKCGCIEK